MSTISKKKSFWKEFYKYYKDDIKFVLTIFAAIAGVVFISFIAIFSSHLFDDFFREADFLTIRHINDCEVNCMHTYFLPTQICM